MFISKDRTVYETVYYIFWIIRSPKDNHLDFISKNTLLISDLKSRFSLICRPYKESIYSAINVYISNLHELVNEACNHEFGYYGTL